MIVAQQAPITDEMLPLHSFIVMAILYRRPWMRTGSRHGCKASLAMRMERTNFRNRQAPVARRKRCAIGIAHVEIPLSDAWEPISLEDLL